MHDLLPRLIQKTLEKRLQTNPSVALLGARQVGKSTIAKIITENHPNAIFLDLENMDDLNKLNNPTLFFKSFPAGIGKHLICIDEIQLKPDLFRILRPIIDNNASNYQFLFLGSASRDLIKQSSETLAGRISYLDVTTLNRLETKNIDFTEYWLRGGYPRSLLAYDNDSSNQWRRDYIRTFLERDIPQLGFSIPATILARFWRMLAHTHGELLNHSKLAASMGVSAKTIRNYIDILEQTFVIRTLPPYHNNEKKRLIKSPKLYIRDVGLLHRLLEIDNLESLFSHPVLGHSYEGIVIENILQLLPEWRASFYRTQNGAEIDLILEKGLETIAIEIKASGAPKTTSGFWQALKDVNATESFIVGQVENAYPYHSDTNVVPLETLLELLQKK